MSKGARMNNNVNYTPGPGNYESHEKYSYVKSKAHGQAFGTEKREMVGRANDMPGPGKYNNEGQKSSIGYKMGVKVHSKLGNDAPGPGAYDMNSMQSTRVKTTTIKIGTSQRSQLINSRS